MESMWTLRTHFWLCLSILVLEVLDSSSSSSSSSYPGAPMLASLSDVLEVDAVEFVCNDTVDEHVQVWAILTASHTLKIKNQLPMLNFLIRQSTTFPSSGRT